MTPETLSAWRDFSSSLADERDRRILALIDALEDMTREARLSREATEKAVKRLEALRDRIAYLHDVYAVSPSEPRCCVDCAANDVSDELRRALADD